MLSHARAEEIIRRLAEASGATPDEFADLLAGRIDSRRVEGRRVTGIRFVRSRHSGSGRYVLDRYGTDDLPGGYEWPVERLDSPAPHQQAA